MWKLRGVGMRSWPLEGQESMKLCYENWFFHAISSAINFFRNVNYIFVIHLGMTGNISQGFTKSPKSINETKIPLTLSIAIKFTVRD